jgi:hypothetical protein
MTRILTGLLTAAVVLATQGTAWAGPSKRVPRAVTVDKSKVPSVGQLSSARVDPGVLKNYLRVKTPVPPVVPRPGPDPGPDSKAGQLQQFVR